MSKTVIIQMWPPMMKVTGDYIKTLLEVESSETVKKWLDKYEIPRSTGYVDTNKVLTKVNEESEENSFIGYTPKSKRSASI